MKVTQISQTIQGEGYHLGLPCILIRLACCNLTCDFCDSKWSLIGGEEKNNKDFAQEIYDLYYKDKEYEPMIMFTGGEPLLQIDDIAEFLEHFYDVSEEKNLVPTVTIESNGVLLKEIGICKKIDILDDFGDITVTISPKLNRDFYPDASIDINSFFDEVDTNCKIYGVNHIYKFVHIKEDEQRILNLVHRLDKYREDIFVMAFTPNKKSEFEEKFHKNCLDCLDFCMKYGFRYSPREHLYLFGLGKKEWDSATTN